MCGIRLVQLQKVDWPLEAGSRLSYGWDGSVRSQGRPLQWKCELGEHPDGWFDEYIS